MEYESHKDISSEYKKSIESLEKQIKKVKLTYEWKLVDKINLTLFFRSEKFNIEMISVSEKQCDQRKIIS